MRDHPPSAPDPEMRPQTGPSVESQEVERRNARRLYAALFSEGAFQDLLDRTAGDLLHEMLSQGAESKLMDAAVGLGHRLKAGHDLSTLFEMVQRDSLGGAETWFRHMLADLMSPDGIPLPGASEVYRFLEDAVGVRERVFVDWTCVSATDVVGGGLSLLILARMHRLAFKQRMQRLGTLTVSQLLFLAFSETNPFFLATIPIQMLLARHEWRKWQLERLQRRVDLSERVRTETDFLLEQSMRLRKLHRPDPSRT